MVGNQDTYVAGVFPRETGEGDHQKDGEGGGLSLRPRL
jgi:hypothetical protein